jgi:hypothetical protein
LTPMQAIVISFRNGLMQPNQWHQSNRLIKTYIFFE